MPEKLYGLTAFQRDLLQEIIDDYRNQRRNTTSRFRGGPRQFQAEEAYIALTPAGGIPALTSAGTGTGTGTGGAFDVAGMAVCDIYRIFQWADIDQVVDLQKQVYNISQVAIPGEVYVTVTKMKSGHWIAQTGGGSGGGSGSTSVNKLVRVSGFAFRSNDNKNFYFNGFIQQMTVAPTNRLILTDGDKVYVNFPNLDHGTGTASPGPFFLAISGYFSCVPSGLNLGFDLYICDMIRQVIDYNAALCQPVLNTTA